MMRKSGFIMSAKGKNRPQFPKCLARLYTPPGRPAVCACVPASNTYGGPGDLLGSERDFVFHLERTAEIISTPR